MPCNENTKNTDTGSKHRDQQALYAQSFVQVLKRITVSYALLNHRNIYLYFERHCNGNPLEGDQQK